MFPQLHVSNNMRSAGKTVVRPPVPNDFYSDVKDIVGTLSPDGHQYDFVIEGFAQEPSFLFLHARDILLPFLGAGGRTYTIDMGFMYVVTDTGFTELGNAYYYYGGVDESMSEYIAFNFENTQSSEEGWSIQMYIYSEFTTFTDPEIFLEVETKWSY